MVQRKIDFYFKMPIQPAGKEKTSPSSPSSTSPRTTFLSLPHEIRRRIYLLVDITRFCPINLNQEGPRARAWKPDPLNIDYYYTLCLFEIRRFYGNTSVLHDIGGCVCPRLPTALLYVSKAISEEVSHILYSENSFTINRSDVWGFKPLRCLSKQATSSLHRLTIRLNNGECIFALPCQGRAEFPPCHPLCKSHGQHDAPLSNKKKQAVPILDEWENLCRRWAPNITPGQLRLDFVCDTTDLPTAQLVVGSLTAHVPRLKECSIRLSLKQNFLQQMLARSTALRLLGAPIESGQSVNTKIHSYYVPSEIIAQIFEYTDLVAPVDLEWRPNGGFAPYDCCLKCTVTLDFCSCHRFHGSYSSTCTCWTPPTALFLVSRRVREIATEVFYARNRFVVMPNNIRLDYTEHNLQHHAGHPRVSPLYRFLDRVPFRAHTLIRYLGLAVPMYPTNMPVPHPDSPGAKAWRHTLRLVSMHMNLSQLQLSIYVGNPCFADYWGNDPGDGEIDAASYRLVLGDLSVLKGLRDLFIYLSWPRDTRDLPLDMEVAAALERQAMGSDYDAFVRGKWDEARRPQIWYHGSSRERKVLAVDGTREWPFYDPDELEENNASPKTPPFLDHVWTLDGTVLDEKLYDLTRRRN
ncbi:hypothetical protein SEUCBS139899_006973 [Sporothrix eucalyptigena]